ncbi:MAG: cobyric acid synthase, partial [Clostridia bacterium]
MRGKCIMLQGTGSSVGKSLLCAALCRIFTQDGLRVAPFKAQNMALNSYATSEGLEMGRAQVTQAQACGIAPRVAMNPVLLKPTSDRRSQVVVMGKPLGNMTAMEYHLYKPALREKIHEVYCELEHSVDCVVLEGAGSPAEINLRQGDIVNMDMAQSADAPVILVGDIDLGGVFASLAGTMLLLTPEERARVKGVIINKFRGDVEILKPGLRQLEEIIHVPVLGVVPYMAVDIEEEDSVTTRFAQAQGHGEIDVAIVQLPHMSNFTDFHIVAMEAGVRVRYVTAPDTLQNADLVILPGTKNTMEDLLALKASGMDAAIVRHARAGGMVVGICGGYQMLGQQLSDPDFTESRVPCLAGLGLLDFSVIFHAEKRTEQAQGVLLQGPDWLESLRGLHVDGYEIHSGVNVFGPACRPLIRLTQRGNTKVDVLDGVSNEAGNVWGTYLHGIFDEGGLYRALIDHVRAQKGIAPGMGETLSLA